MRNISSPVPDLRHSFTARHPDAIRNLSFIEAADAVETRGDLVKDITIRAEHLAVVREWLEANVAVLIIQPPHQITIEHDRWMLMFYRPWEASQFEGWLSAQEVMARALGMVASGQ